MTRHSITNGTVEQVNEVGGNNVKFMRHSGVIFADLTEDQVKKLESQGCNVKKLSKIEAADGVKPAHSKTIPATIGVIEDVIPPEPIEAEPIYSPAQIFAQLGFEEARKLTDPPLYGAGINVAIIDSGVRKSHDEIGEDSVVYEHDYTGGDNPSDVFDHGTGVAHVVKIVVPESGILNLKVLNDDGMGSPEHLIEAIEDCLTMHDEQSEYAPRIINLSLGIPYEQSEGYDDPVRIACRAAIEQYNVWIIAAAGNSGPGPNTMLVPAVEKYVLAVGSCRFDPFEVSVWSSRGPSIEPPYATKPDAVFLGENIMVASCKSDIASVAKSGTSYAAPFLSGLCAMYQEVILIHQIEKYPEHLFGPMELLELIRMEDLIDTHLIRFCVKPEEVGPGKDNNYGNGLPYGPLFIGLLKPVYVPDFSNLINGMLMIVMLGAVVKTMK